MMVTHMLIWVHYAGLIVWLTAFAAMLRPAIRVVVRTGGATDFDVIWALLAGVAFMILGYNLRWLFNVDSDAIRLGLSAFSILLGGFALGIRFLHWAAPRG